jgi:stage II sporulation SpoAA-like protein
MVEEIQDMPAGTVGFRATGDIRARDYEEVLRPRLKQALEADQGLRTLYVIEDLKGIDPSALWADARLGYDAGIKHRDAWVRSAIVTDIEWMARAARVFAWMIPGETRVFPLAELEQAKAWIAGG